MTHKVFRKDLKPGNILPIWLNYKEQTNFRGNALLLERLVDKEPPKDQKEYEFAEIGGINPQRKQDKVQILYNWQLWRVKFTDGNNKDFITSVKIAHYQRTFWQKEYEDN